MEYMEAFIHENLRLHPPIVMQVRTCTKDCEVSNADACVLKDNDQMV